MHRPAVTNLRISVWPRVAQPGCTGRLSGGVWAGLGWVSSGSGAAMCRPVSMTTPFGPTVNWSCGTVRNCERPRHRV